MPSWIWELNYIHTAVDSLIYQEQFINTLHFRYFSNFNELCGKARLTLIRQLTDKGQPYNHFENI